MSHLNPAVDGGTGGRGTRQVLTFALGAEVYAVDILCLKEIRGWSPVTRIPHSPPCVLGVLNLRGAVVPIIDTRVRFGLQAAEFTAVTVVIVLSLSSGSGVRECGIVVDKVLDVVDVPTERIKPAPAEHGTAAGECIDGIATLEEQMLILLNAGSLVLVN